ncbi:expressed unknown protein [Seminavis robusta]|uniref:Uncharacterized protein n=1 Tax=Seminavis robusta TaxID=568900 RepID=A0A9N8ESH0_9STRA|nr:expressed unknown protein [Seminavis robusta]|eukprot:Sro1552_g281820.1 n/a (155) ;mRNA; r:17006-17470
MTFHWVGGSASIAVRTVRGTLGTRRLFHHLSALNGSHLVSKPTIPQEPTSHSSNGDVRQFASAREAAFKKDEAATPSPAELTFSTPQVKELYERMIQLERDQVSLVGEMVLGTLRMPVEQDEFYYHGIGKSGGRGGAGAAAPVEVVEAVKKGQI